jgi:hypothetical protein
MKKIDQKRIVRELLAGLRESLLADLHKVPETWDGIELRQWVADRARAQTSKTLKGKRHTEYLADCAVRNL